MSRQRIGAPRKTLTGAAPAPGVLDAIVRRIVEVAHPRGIILFGAAARDELTGHSNVDLLVVANVEDLTPYATVPRYPGT